MENCRERKREEDTVLSIEGGMSINQIISESKWLMRMVL